jgi:hypothetical protein
MTLLILSILVLGLLAYLLLMPLELCLDSYRQRYYLRLGSLARISVEKDPVALLRLHLRVLFMNFFWRPSDLQQWKRQNKKPGAKKTGGKSRGITMGQVQKILRSFRVKAFRIELDTGNPMLNARLFPIFYLLRKQGREVGINFLGRNQVLVRIANRPIYILNTFINLKK